ncbi:SHOCT domain-containing protein [Halorussus salinisoli]|uniref:hypothetical protein n=1 Tax=Halorussus salinisoli TaxID=2558242 RepID=UPI0010C2372A|nr:hypothetical protein [Halorussus salinisoli]
MGRWGMGGSSMWGFSFVWLLLVLLIIAVIAIGAAYLFIQRSTTTDSNRAMDLLREQYARGEITTGTNDCATIARTRGVGIA